MLLAQSGSEKLENVLVASLHTQEASGPALLAAAQAFDPSITKESFYRTLRKLLVEEVVTKQDKIYRLNFRWLQRVYRFSKRYIETSYGVGQDDVLSFREGDTISYRFGTPNLLGIYWAHIYDMIFDLHDPKVPILISHPHEWFIHARTESESFFLNRFEEDRKLVFFSLASSTPLDKAFKKGWDSKFRQIGVGIHLGLKRTEYLNVLGDFIIRVSVSKRFSEDLDSFFERNPVMTPAAKRELIKLGSRKDPARMTFIRSRKEAEKWRIKYNKYFFVPNTRN
ncbi:MAG: hypothetical protein V4480_03095 [Patescibacteria group bacterium]